MPFFVYYLLRFLLLLITNGDKVQLVGFGTFETRDRAAREGRNPRNGQIVKIPFCKLLVFKAGKALKDAVNK